jgi:hypothetical protein
MKKKLILGTILTLSLAFIVSAACVAPAFAVTTHQEHVNAGGQSVIDVPGHTNIQVAVSHSNWGDFFAGSADRIQVFVSTGLAPPAPPFKYVAAYEDNPERIAFSWEVGGGAIQLKRGQLQIFRICKTVFIYWTVPLVLPATTTNPLGPPTPAVTLPPGCLVLRGYGDAQVSEIVMPFPLSGWTSKYESTVYNAKATFICPGWHYCGPVSEAFTPTRMVTEGTITWTHP